MSPAAHTQVALARSFPTWMQQVIDLTPASAGTPQERYAAEVEVAPALPLLVFWRQEMDREEE